ncbi:DNA-binding transcriptional regulator, LysR family [Vibrio xiamenensis]|uniref:DNA-binding transcriptional regulator, LysR family n=1 Tax=Vibrio xiamenensis TaxID=861298 RepID=A0A1G8A2W0_9VIBR|nr:LysR family transcriptional regulator [Vibrio xiamenensis]SDH15226.1 DNA-binding transcriptional regulator, LysR family [Vibrio xiamenensis]
MHSFSSLPIFVSVVECGSFSAAAKQLKITKSAVSKRINQLEDELGTRLINRTTRTLSLTEAGKRYFDYACQAVHLAQQGIDSVTELQGSPQGLLRITAPMSFGVAYVAPLISEFIEHHPNVEVELVLEDKVVDLVQDGYDLAIRIGELESSNLIAKRLSPCKSVVCASPDYLATHGEPQKPSDLVNHNCLRYTYFRGGQEWRFFEGNQQVRVVPKGNFSVNNSEAIRRALLDGLGIAQMPTFIVARDIASGRLKPLLPLYSLPLHAIYAVFPERKHMPLKVRSFIDFIEHKLGSETPSWDRLYQ